MVDFPHPETPMTTTTAVAMGEALGRTSTDINALLLTTLYDP